MTASPVRRQRVSAVDMVTLDSQGNRNALSLLMLRELVEAVSEAAAGDCRALVIDHAGPVFCSGVDLKERRELGADDDRHSRLLAQLLGELWACPKPVLCRVDGAVRGGGMGLVACADLVVASTGSTFAYSEVRVGVAPALVAAVALRGQVSAAALLPWLLTGDVFDADTAHRLALVSRVAVDGASLDPEVAALLASAPGAVIAMKRLVRESTGADLTSLLDEMAALSAQLFATPEAAEGMAAFSERRPPAWAPG